MMADGYATAINILGPEEGYQFALQHNLPVLMIIKNENLFVEKSTEQFDNITDKK
jgi:thiamine biosynthesis lipoprotein